MSKVDTEIVTDYCETYPHEKDRTLAKRILADNPDIYGGILERVRGAVRIRRGHSGAVHRRKVPVIIPRKEHPAHATPLAKPTGQFGPRILVFDIETSPMESYHWRCFKENIAPVQIKEYSKVLCWAAKWLGAKDVMFERVTNYKNDKAVCSSIWDLFNQADIVVAHNGRAFDVNFLQSRWIDHGMNPPSPYKIVDTLKIAKNQLAVPSRALEALLRYFSLGGKAQHFGFQTWLDCMANKPKAWATMKKYNIVDALKLEQLYLLIRPWAATHPNVSLCYEDSQTRCIVCGGRNLLELAETAKTAVSEFKALRCSSCGKIMRVGKRFKPDKKDILRNVM